MGKGGGGTDEKRGVGGGREIKGEEGRGWRWRWGASCSASSGVTRSSRGAAGDRDRGGGDGEGGGTDEKLADLTNVRRKETREDRNDADERGGRSPVRRSWNSDRGVTWGR